MYTIAEIKRKAEAGGYKPRYKYHVWVGNLAKTPGGLTRGDLMKNKRGKIVSKRQRAHGMRSKANLTAPRFM